MDIRLERPLSCRVLGFLRLVIGAQLVTATTLAFTVDPVPLATEASRPGPAATPQTAPMATSTVAPTVQPTAAKRITTTTSQPVSAKLQPPARGKYSYRTRITGAQGAREYNGTLVYSSAKEAEGEIRQTDIDHDDEGYTYSGLAWRDDGLYLRFFDHRVWFDGTFKCDIEPDLLVYPSPLAVGRSWTFASACNESDAVVRFDGASRVTRTALVTVANRRVPVFVIETEGRVPYADLAAADFRSVDFFSVEKGLSVRVETTYRYEVDEQHFEERETTELLALDPAPLDESPPSMSP